MIALTLFLSLHLRSQFGPCQTQRCYGNSCDCNQWSNWEQRTIMMHYPDFPECSLMVTYCYRQCVDPANDTAHTCVEIYIQNIQAVAPYCGDCSRFIQWLEEGNDIQKGRKARGVFIFFFRYIVFTDWYDFISDIEPEDYPYCDMPGEVRKKYHYRTAACIGYCKTQYPVGMPNVRLLIEPYECENQACCLRKIELCIDRVTGQTMSWETLQTIPTTYCEDVFVPIEVCKPGTNVTATKCKHNCTED
ncbi:MAG: hypothetical protein ABIK31_07445 [candidate division WOR-3 bacterium]